MELLAGLLVGGVLLALGIGVSRKRPGASTSTAPQGQRSVASAVADYKRTEGVNVNRDIEVGLEWGAAGLAAGTTIGAAFGAAAGPIGAVVGAFVGAFVGLIKSASDTEDYGTVVRHALRDYLSAAQQPTSQGHIDAMVFRDALLAASAVWVNERTGQLALEVLQLAHGRREHFHNLPYPPSFLSVGEGIIPGDAARSTWGLVEGANVERLDGPDQRRARRSWWADMHIGDLCPIEFSTGHASWNPSGSYTSGPGFSRLWPSLGTRKVTRSPQWHRVKPNAATVDALAAGFDRAAGLAWRNPA